MEIKRTRIGDFIQARREEQELTQAQLAAQLPITASTLGQIERGDIETPSQPVLEALAEALGVALSTLTNLLTDDAEPLERVAANSLVKHINLLSLTDSLAVIGGYGVIFGGRDLEGDTFTAETKFHTENMPTPPVFYDHTLGDIPHELGNVIKMTAQESGLWIEAQLDRNKEYVDEVLKLIEEGALGWSSGSVSHLVRRDENKQITNWPIVEFSLTPVPAEPRTLADMTRIKTAKDSTFEALPEAEQSAVNAGEETTADEIIIDEELIETQKENPTMSETITMTTEQLTAMVDAAASKAADHIMKAQPANDVGFATEPAKKDNSVKAAMSFVRTGSTKDMTVSVDADGGYTVPDEWLNTLTTAMVQSSIFRMLPGIRVIRRANGRVLHDISADAPAAATIVGECVAFPDKQPTFAEALINTFKYACDTIVSHELLQDSMFNIESILSDRVAKSFALAENRDFVTGDGTTAPQGVLLGGTQGVLAALPTVFTADEIIDLLFSIETPYLMSGTPAWLMNRTTAAYIRKLKDGDDRYLWSTGGGLVDGAQAMLLDYPVFIIDTMPSIAAGTKPLVFGNFNAMTIYEAGGIQMLRDPYSQKDCGIEFSWWKREAARIHDSASIKYLEMAP